MIAATQPDQIPTTTPYAPFIAPSMRAVLPLLDAETVKFFVIAATHRDALNRIFPGTQAWMGYGYHPTAMARLYERCCGLGLMRLLAESGRDLYGRWQSAVYQLNPALVYVDPRRYPEAMGLSDAPFIALPGQSPDQGFRSKSDPVGFRSSLTPDQVSRLESDPAMNQAESEKQNPEAESGSEIQEGESGKQNHVPPKMEPRFLPGNLQSAPDAYSKEQPQGRSKPEPARTRTSANSAPTTPLPPAAPKKGELKKYANPLPSGVDERVASAFAAVGKHSTTKAHARMYVDRYGAQAVMDVLTHVTEMSEDDRRKITNLTGYMVSLLKVGVASVPPGEYDMNDPHDCWLAINDTTLPNDERHVFEFTLDKVHNLLFAYQQNYGRQPGESVEQFETRIDTEIDTRKGLR